MLLNVLSIFFTKTIYDKCELWLHISRGWNYFVPSPKINKIELGEFFLFSEFYFSKTKSV